METPPQHPCRAWELEAVLVPSVCLWFVPLQTHFSSPCKGAFAHPAHRPPLPDFPGAAGCLGVVDNPCHANGPPARGAEGAPAPAAACLTPADAKLLQRPELAQSARRLWLKKYQAAAASVATAEEFGSFLLPGSQMSGWN